MLTHAEALTAIASITPLILSESVPLERADRRWLADDVRLDRDQPPFDRSTMDGYAICLSDGVTTFTVRGSVHAGETWRGAALNPGEAVRIMTGAPAPANTTVVPIECTDGGREQVTITEAKALAAKRNIAWQGEDGHAGDIVVPAGRRLSPTTLAAAAMCGADHVTCWRLPTCAIVTTGDEVGGAGTAAIADSNGPLLASFLGRLGLSHRRHHARDSEEDLHRVLAAAATEADIVITTGGVSAGAKDLVPDLAARLGFANVFHHVAIQPGKPVYLARRDAPRGSASAFIGLPGNPVSVLATAHLYLLPLIGRFCGAWQPSWLQLPLTLPWANRGRRHLFLPARIVDGGIAPIRWNGSGDLIAAAAGDGLVELPLGFDGSAGTPVRFLPYVGELGASGVIPPR